MKFGLLWSVIQGGGCGFTSVRFRIHLPYKLSLGIKRGLHGRNVEMVVGGACWDAKCGEPSI